MTFTATILYGLFTDFHYTFDFSIPDYILEKEIDLILDGQEISDNKYFDLQEEYFWDSFNSALDISQEDCVEGFFSVPILLKEMIKRNFSNTRRENPSFVKNIRQ